ncbi:methionyl aminopeptidase [Thiospirochaeta perfilievii]|uniref:Methionyl aminopeptidase n=1 Tax=Thiospirochaeta perfilievii TaxID=252967 RepID=A0A5C1QFP5_9SPIO|nr:methionyl aminopeptidase [Thiospirochaeta perfilievii]QEN05889.1 methionyl aminopeptidase [Thiospirochaeta perfilievii]
MRASLKIAGKTHETLFYNLEPLVVPGVTLIFIYNFCMDFFKSKSLNIIPDTIPVTINTNNIVYHGQNLDRVLIQGDIVTIDVCFRLGDGSVDGAKTFIVGNCSDRVRDLVDVSRDVIKEAVNRIRPGVKVNEVVSFISDYISIRGFYLLPDGIGHGIGESLHVSPFISLNDFTDFNYVFKVGDLFTLEPVVLMFKEVITESDSGEGIADITNFSSQFEITIYIDKYGSIVILNKALLN